MSSSNSRKKTKTAAPGTGNKSAANQDKKKKPSQVQPQETKVETYDLTNILEEGNRKLRQDNSDKDKEIERLKEKLEQYEKGKPSEVPLQNAKAEDNNVKEKSEEAERKDLKEKNQSQIKILEEHNRQLQEQLSQLQAANNAQNSGEKQSSKVDLQAVIKKHDETIKDQKVVIEKILTDLDEEIRRKRELEATLQEKEKELKKRDEIIENLQSTTKKTSEKDDLKDENSRQSDIAKLEEEKKTIVTENEKLKNEKESIEKASQKNIQKLTEMENEMKQMKEDHKRDIQAKELSSQENIQKLTDMENKMKQMKEDHKKDIDAKESQIAQLKKDKGAGDKTGGTSARAEMKGSNDKLEQTKKELNEAKQEIEELKQRLSKVIGAKITNDNPDITDLSDLNRPTKLAERYSELYDNEWTDAYEEVENECSSELEVIKHLHQRLMDIYEFCQKTSDEYSKNLKACAFSLPSDGNKRPKSAKIDVASMRQLKELRKSFAQNLVENVFQHYIESKKLDMKKKPKTGKFIRECVRVCWLMSSQDPPVILDTSNVKGAFDGDRFRTYTKSGKNVDFVVWPPMLLHKNGPLLGKGVAQGK